MGKDKHASPIHHGLNKIEKAKRCMERLKKCGCIWMLISVLLVIVGVLVLIFFAKYISTEEWQRGVGITGIVFLLLGILGLVIAIGLIWSFCYLVKRQESGMHGGFADNKKYHEHTGTFAKDLYPRQPGYEDNKAYQQELAAGGAQASSPTGAPVSPDSIVIEPTEKF